MKTFDNLSIRHLIPEDTSLMKEMGYRAAFPNDGHNASVQAYEKAATEVEPWMRDYTEGFGRDGDHGLVVVEGKTDNIATAWFRHYGIEGLPAYEVTLAVREDRQRLGIGSMLIRYLLNDAYFKEIPELGIQVQPDNIKALKLYESQGFKSLSEYFGYIVMSAPTSPLKTNHYNLPRDN